MLIIQSRRRARDCDGLSRRDFIQAGTLALGSLSLPLLLQARASATSAGKDYVRDKSVVLLFLSGGASHIETFNPNMSVPAPYHSVTGEVQTTIPGITFGGTFPGLAQHAKDAAIVRSFQHPIGGHVQAISHVLTGGTDQSGQAEQGFSVGSMCSRIRGANNDGTGLPTYCLLQSKEVDPQYRNERGRVARGSRSGILGPSYEPFAPDGKGTALENMRLSIPEGRLGDRAGLLEKLDGIKRKVDQANDSERRDKFTQQAMDLLLGGASRAFDLSEEDPRLIKQYDTSDFRVGKKSFRPADLGSHFLVARRLIEAGCGFVTIHSAGWDMHADGNNPGIHAGMEMLGRPMDKAVSAFLTDIKDRGLSEKVLLIITGDFGRTPKVNKRGGRDHWPKLCTLALFGGGLKTGQLIGRSARNNDVPDTNPITPSGLLSTVIRTLFDTGSLRLDPSVPRDLGRLIENGKPISELF